jgi:4-amino-4-deoxy-L-arabinose transferase-like glycosyltransferase
MVVAFGLRYFAATTVPMPWEEARLVHEADAISLSPGALKLPVHTMGRHLAGQLYVAKLGTLLLGHNIAGFRFMSVVLGTASCWIVFALARRMWGAWPATLALLLMCFNGFHIGVSRFAIERTYLFFSALAIYLFWRAVQEDRPRYMVMAGGVLGVGALVSEHTLLLLPAFGLYLALSGPHRPWLRRPAPYIGVLVAVAVCAPFVYLYLTDPDLRTQLGSDYADHARRLGTLGLSYGPLTLYVPPLYYKLSGRVSEYPVMSLAGGLLLLGAVVWAHLVRRDACTTLLLVVFWVFLGVFSLFTSDRPEFKWTATSLFAAVPLGGAMLWALWRRWPAYGIAACLPLLYIGWFGCWVANRSYNAYYSPVVPPAAEHISGPQFFHGVVTGAAGCYDFPSLVGSPMFPARYRRYYLHHYVFVALLAHEGALSPALMRPALERAARIDPDHPEVARLTAALLRREAEDRQAGREYPLDGRQFFQDLGALGRHGDRLSGTVILPPGVDIMDILKEPEPRAP